MTTLDALLWIFTAAVALFCVAAVSDRWEATLSRWATTIFQLGRKR